MYTMIRIYEPSILIGSKLGASAKGACGAVPRADCAVLAFIGCVASQALGVVQGFVMQNEERCWHYPAITEKSRRDETSVCLGSVNAA